MTGKELQKKIRKSGMTQKVLAEKMGIHPSQWTTYFKQDSVTSDVVEKVARLLGMTMGQFYGEVAADEAGGAIVCDQRLLDAISARDRQIDACQEQISRLLRIIDERIVALAASPSR